MPRVNGQTDAVSDAHAAVRRAEEKIAEGERQRDEAFERLDQALATRGWRRLFGGFDSRLYAQLGGNAVPLSDVLEHELRVTG